jgi:hypothetical protein
MVSALPLSLFSFGVSENTIIENIKIQITIFFVWQVSLFTYLIFDIL